ncbi:unnamed protein product [Hapterophycus canaliculatus]
MVGNEISYNCVEQYIMTEKARLFGDSHALTLIMNTAEPPAHKSFGRRRISRSKFETSSDRTSVSPDALPVFPRTLSCANTLSTLAIACWLKRALLTQSEETASAPITVSRHSRIGGLASIYWATR